MVLRGTEKSSIGMVGSERDINFEAVKLEVSIRKPGKGAQHEMERPSPHRAWTSATPPLLFLQITAWPVSCS